MPKNGNKSADEAPNTISLSFAIITFVFCIIISFSGGCAFRSQYLYPEKVGGIENGLSEVVEDVEVIPDDKVSMESIFVPFFEEPETEHIYTTKQFDVDGTEKVSTIIPRRLQDDNDDDDDDDDDEDEDDDDEEDEDNEKTEVEDHLSDTEQSPGQMLRVSIQNVDSDLLQNKDNLIKKFIKIMTDGSLPLPLSYHCRPLYETGVSCVGILGNSLGERGHFAFYTWPENGGISFDLRTSPFNPLLHITPIFQSEFGVVDPFTDQTCLSVDYKSENCMDPLSIPKATWKHSMTGFKRKQSRHHPLEDDISDDFLDTVPMDYLKEIVTVQSNFQRIDIWDFMNFNSQRNYTHSLKSVSGDDSYYAQHRELFVPDRVVFLDGVTQSFKTDDEGYHETLVQPAMFAHQNPRRAAIIGGGEGATLREVLRHNTIEHVKMIEIDQIMVEVSREYLPSWSDCSDLVGSSQNCLDAPRADVIYEDAVAWFRNRKFYPHGSNDIDDNFNIEQFDVVIVDALDPQDKAEFSDVLYKDDSFLSSVFRSLSHDGIMVMQLGPAPMFDDAAEEFTNNANRVLIFKTLEHFGFASMQVYEEHHCGFEDAWAFVIACKEISCRDNWYASESIIDLNIRKRLIQTKSKKPSLKHFDGATMNKYRFSARDWESVYCRSPTPHPDCSSFDGFNPAQTIVTSENFEGNKEGLFAKIDIQEGDLLLVDEQVHSIHFPSKAVDVVESMATKLETFTPLADFINDFEIKNGLKYETNEVYTPSSILNLANEAGDPNSGNAYLHSDKTKSTAKGLLNVNVYNPIISRRFEQAIVSFKAKRNISSGEQIFV